MLTTQTCSDSEVVGDEDLRQRASRGAIDGMTMKMVLVGAVVMAMGCGTTNNFYAPRDDASQSDSDAATTDGAVKVGDMATSSGPHDFATQPGSDLSVTPVADMAVVPPADLSVCSDVPWCGSNGPLDCCNGALACTNHLCQNLPGQPCNLDSKKGPVVTCWYALNMGGPSGVCGGGGTCLP